VAGAAARSRGRTACRRGCEERQALYPCEAGAARSRGGWLIIIETETRRDDSGHGAAAAGFCEQGKRDMETAPGSGLLAAEENDGEKNEVR